MSEEELLEELKRHFDFLNEMRDNAINMLELKVNIIEEAREYIVDNFSNEDTSIWHEDMKKILEILDKGKNND